MRFIQAILSDTTEEFISIPEPQPGDRLVIRLRTAKNDADRAEYVFPGQEPVRMLRVFSDRLFDWYEAEVPVGEEALRWCFRLTGRNEEGGEQVVWYDMLGPSEEHDDDYDFRVIPGFRTPDWAKGAVLYQIFPDRFCNGDPGNDVRTGEYVYMEEPVRRVEEDALPEDPDVGLFHGGDLEGVTRKLDYLRDLGVNGIYLNPVFVSPSSHKYDTEDYEHVDPHLGGDAALETLLREAHARGMRVILDGVFNHCSDRHRWFAERPEFFGRNADGETEYWWDNKTLPKLNYEGSEELEEEILAIARKWLRPPYRADGWRLDVAADLGHSEQYNHSFWKRFREAVKQEDPEALILAEHYGDPQPWLDGSQWDTVMNYDGFMDPVSWFLTGMEKHSDRAEADLCGDAAAFRSLMDRGRSRMTAPSLLCAMNELDNHDHSRFLTRTNRRTGRLVPDGPEAAEEGVSVPVLRQAVLLQMTMCGAPTVYYGDEAGLCGWTDPDCRRMFPWGREDRELTDYYRQLGRLHNGSPALRRGSLVWLAAEGCVLAYARVRGNDRMIVVLHAGEGEEFDLDVPVWLAGLEDGAAVRGVMYTDCYDYGFRGEVREVREGRVRVRLKPHTGLLLKGV